MINTSTSLLSLCMFVEMCIVARLQCCICPAILLESAEHSKQMSNKTNAVPHNMILLLICVELLYWYYMHMVTLVIVR